MIPDIWYILVCALPVAAPEIARVSEKRHVAALLPGLEGIQVREFAWQKAEEEK